MIDIFQYLVYRYCKFKMILSGLRFHPKTSGILYSNLFVENTSFEESQIVDES